MPLPECRQRSSVSGVGRRVSNSSVFSVSSQWLDGRRGRVLGAFNSVAFQVGSLAASPLLGGTCTDLRVCMDAGRVGGRIVGSATEIADGGAQKASARRFRPVRRAVVTAD
jgi:MFS family permease